MGGGATLVVDRIRSRLSWWCRGTSARCHRVGLGPEPCGQCLVWLRGLVVTFPGESGGACRHRGRDQRSEVRDRRTAINDQPTAAWACCVGGRAGREGVGRRRGVGSVGVTLRRFPPIVDAARGRAGSNGAVRCHSSSGTTSGGTWQARRRHLRQAPVGMPISSSSDQWGLRGAVRKHHRKHTYRQRPWPCLHGGDSSPLLFTLCPACPAPGGGHRWGGVGGDGEGRDGRRGETREKGGCESAGLRPSLRGRGTAQLPNRHQLALL